MFQFSCSNKEMLQTKRRREIGFYYILLIKIGVFTITRLKTTVHVQEW